jgi:hypothetical protein
MRSPRDRRQAHTTDCIVAAVLTAFSFVVFWGLLALLVVASTRT